MYGEGGSRSGSLQHIELLQQNGWFMETKSKKIDTNEITIAQELKMKVVIVWSYDMLITRCSSSSSSFFSAPLLL